LKRGGQAGRSGTFSHEVVPNTPDEILKYWFMAIRIGRVVEDA